MKTSTQLISTAMVAVAIFFGTSVKAQNSTSSAMAGTDGGWHLGIGVEGGVPTSNLHDISNVYLGGTARLQYDFASHLSAMLTSGYYNAFGKTVNGYKYGSLGIVPVKAGLKYFAAPNFYVSGEAGVGIETNYTKDTKLLLSPGIGYANNSGIDIGLRYENFSGQSNSYGIVGLRLAYGFKL